MPRLSIPTLESHGVAAACKAAFSGFDSHQRLAATSSWHGRHLGNVLVRTKSSLGVSLISLNCPSGLHQHVCNPCASRHDVLTILR
jgi:hypothetical protein